MARTGKRLDPGRTGGQAQKLEVGLQDRIVGQQEAVQQIVDIYQTHLAGLTQAGRPIGNLLFLGPTGSGKTRIVEAAAEVLLGDARAVIKIDCAEFQHSHEIAKLIGSPPGYLGHRETLPLLCQENLNRWQTDTVKISLVLFDEIEKASDALWNLLLGILDKAALTLGDNRRVDFSRAMIFMTSNLGAAEMSRLIEPKLGFTLAAAPQDIEGKVERTGLDAARRKFTPEFINRIDKIVVFKPLGEVELRRVLDLELRAVQHRVVTDCGEPFGFTLTEAAKNHVLGEGVDLRYGARHLKRAIERLVVRPLANLVASEQVARGDWLCVDYDGESGMVFSKEAEGMPATAIAALLECLPPAAMAAQRTAQGAVPATARGASGELNFGE